MNIFKKIALGFVLISSANTLFALESCPSVDSLRSFNYEGSLPFGYDKTTKRLKSLSFASQISTETSEKMMLAVSPVPVASEEEPEHALHALLAKVNMETSKPLMFRVAEDFVLPVCVYTLAKDPNFSAFVFVDDGIMDDDDTEDLKRHVTLGMIKQLLLK